MQGLVPSNHGRTKPTAVKPKPRPPPKPKPPKSAAVSADLGLESATLNVNNLDQLEVMLQGEATTGATSMIFYVFSIRD